MSHILFKTSVLISETDFEKNLGNYFWECSLTNFRGISEHLCGYISQNVYPGSFQLYFLEHVYQAIW